MKVKQLIKVAEAIDDSRKMPCDMHELEDTKYFSHSKQDFIAIADMDIVHLVRAFKNDRHRLNNQLTDKDLIRQNEDLVSANRQLARQHDIWKEKAMNMMEKSSYDDIENTLKGTIKANNELIQLNKQLKESLRQVNLTPTVSTQAYDIAWKNNEVLKKQVEHWKKTAESNFIQSVKDCEDKDTWAKKYDNEVKESEFWKNRYHDFISVDSFKASAKGCNYVFSEIPNNCDGQRFTDDMKQYLNKDSYKLRVRGQYLDEETKRMEGWRKYEAGQPIDKSKCLRVYIDKK